MGRINMKSLRVSSLEGFIVSFKPFYFIYTGLDSLKHSITFKCPVCGSNSCEKIDPNDNLDFWSSHFRCIKCGSDRDKYMHDFTSYNDCFIDHVSEPVQLELF